MMEEKNQEIEHVIDKIRPYIQRDGGDVEFIAFEDGIVYVKMLGACSDCLMQDDTIKDGVEMILMEEVEGVKEVKVIES